MHDHLRGETEKDEFEEAESKSEARPIVPVLQYLKAVAIEVDVPIKVHVVERLKGNLVSSTILGLIGVMLEGQVVLDWATRKLDFLVLAWAERRRDSPEGHQDRDGGEEAKEDCGLQAASDFPR
jgi:hypothetical protein